MSDLEASDDDVAFVAASRDGPEDVGLAAPVVREPLAAAVVVGAVDALGFLPVAEAVALPLGICEAVGEGPVVGEGAVPASPEAGFFAPPPTPALGLGPSVLSTGFEEVEDFAAPTLLTAGLDPGLAAPALNLLPAGLVAALVGLSLATFCARSCFFFSSKAFLFSAMASAFSLSFSRFSSSFFFLSASCCSLRLLEGTLILPVTGAVALGSVGLFAAFASAVLLDTGLVLAGLPMAEVGFFVSRLGDRNVI